MKPNPKAKRHYLSYFNSVENRLYLHDCVRIRNGFRSVNYFCLCLDKLVILPAHSRITEDDDEPKGNGEIYDMTIRDYGDLYLEIDENTFISLIFNEGSKKLEAITSDIIKRMTEKREDQ